MLFFCVCFSVNLFPVAFASDIQTADTTSLNYLVANNGGNTTMYAQDGRTAEVSNANVAAWEAVGWYKNKSSVCTTMYAADGRTAEVFNASVAAWEAVGWYRYPVTVMYALNGRTMVVANNAVDANKRVGWYLYGVDYICARAEQIVLYEGYYPAVVFVSDQVNSLEANSEYCTPLYNKIDSLMQRWYKSTGCPIAVASNGITEDYFGMPEANIEFINVTEKEISSFDVSFVCYDAYGRQTSDISNSGRFIGTADRIGLPSYSSQVVAWSLWGHGRTAWIGNIQITAVAFSDGTTWYR